MAPFLRRIIFIACASLLMLGVLAIPLTASAEEGRHYCEASYGVILVQRGSATCYADGDSYAVASGRNAVANAYFGGKAEAIGNRSYANAGQVGGGGTAAAHGVDSYAVADSGGVATATGRGSYAAAHVGSASAYGNNSSAQAVDWYSIAVADGKNSQAYAISGGQSQATGRNSFVHAGGFGAVSTASGNWSNASAYGSCTVYAGPHETQTCTGP